MRRLFEEHVFRREGEYWTMIYGRQTVRLRDGAGLRYLAALIRRPGEAVHATELRAAAAEREGTRRGRPKSTSGDRDRDRLAVTKGIKSALARITAAHPALGGHFAATLRCGYQCRYLPDPRHPIRWVE